jgi:2-polyprenyl-6-methoxyphenol hydroxylase-like FAD-dependent oxidoreductase
MIKERFAVVGGGIGGLTVAIALQKKGFDVVVYEHAREWSPLGAGIILAGNAMKAFREINLDEQILVAGREMNQFVIKDESGKVISRADGQKINQAYGLVNTLTLHRADLHNVLYNALLPHTVQLGKACIDFREDTDGVRMFFTDGTSSHADYVIAADGIHSVFRKKLLPARGLRYSGYTCWRGVTSEIPEGFDNSIASESWGAGLRFGIVPLSKNRVYWFATANAGERDKKMAGFKIDDLVSLYRSFHDPVTKLIQATCEENVLHHDIVDFKPIAQFAFGKIVLLGDAAHATTPNLGQGACMAIEDGVVLGNCLASSSTPVQGFQQFQQKRIARTTQVVNTSYRLGKVVQTESRILAGLRNAAMRLTPESVTQKQVRFLYDVSFS